jgi:hypothetical protein
VCVQLPASNGCTGIVGRDYDCRDGGGKLYPGTDGWVGAARRSAPLGPLSLCELLHTGSSDVSPQAVCVKFSKRDKE